MSLMIHADVPLIHIILKINFFFQIINMEDVFFQDGSCKGVGDQSLAEERTQFQSSEHRVLSIAHLSHLTEKSCHHLQFYADNPAHSDAKEEVEQQLILFDILKDSDESMLLLFVWDVQFLNDKVQVDIPVVAGVVADEFQEVVDEFSPRKCEGDDVESIVASQVNEPISN